MVKTNTAMEGLVKGALKKPKKTKAPGTKGSVQRDDSADAIPEDERTAVSNWQYEIRADKKYFGKKFDKMRENMEYARLGARKDWVDADNYTVPIIGRFINQAVAALYAKNPKAEAKRKQKLLYSNWDGTQETAQAALSAVQQPGGDPTGQAQAVLQDVAQAKQYDQMMDRMGKTLEILFEYFTGEDFPDFKKRMKSGVRRTKTTAVSYVEVSFHRAMEPDPDVVERIGDMQNEIRLINSRKADLADGEYDKEDPRAIELVSMLETLEQEKMKIATEGLMFDFPRSTDIIPHRACTQLSGFIGCDYVTREYSMTVEEIQTMFSVDVSKSFKVYTPAATVGQKNAAASTMGSDQEGDRDQTNADDTDMKSSTAKKNDKENACVWRTQNKKTRQEFWTCDGYPGYLRQPKAPDNQVHGFWTIFSLIFNEVEDDKEVFPPSDVEYMQHPQREYNNARQGVREHRRANRPKYFVKKGALSEKDKETLQSAPAHAVLELGGIEKDVNIEQIIQPYKGVPLDPNMYETASIMKDVLYGVGVQSADLGQTGDATATESSIAEQSRMSTLASNVDDLDEFLSEIARASSQILLQQMNKESVIEIVGPGAMWPELNSEQVAKELFLNVRAGSSGRPNQAARLAALERAMQYLIQLGHINPVVLSKEYGDLLDLDLDEFIVEGMPSIISLNAMAQQHAQAVAQIGTNVATSAAENAHQGAGQPAAAGAPGPTGSRPAAPGAPMPQMQHENPAQNPAMQGAAGHGNAPQAPGVTPQGQPAFPAPTAHVQ